MKATLLVLIALLGFGCRGTAAPPPTATPTATPAAIVVSGPLDQADAFASNGPEAWQRQFVLDIETKKIFAVDIWKERLPPGTQYGSIQWIDDDTIGVPTTTGRYRAPLSGTVSFEPGAADIRQVLKAPALASPDRAWQLEVSDGGLKLTGPDGAALALPSGPYAWSPTGHQIATGAGRCGDGQLTLADPAVPRILPISNPDGSFVTLYLWRPDSLSLAVDFIDTLALVRASDGASELLAPLPPAHPNTELIPLAWSPSGTRLIIDFQGGYDCID
jgi:hypothetical protein